jgi:hypothetical protein
MTRPREVEAPGAGVGAGGRAQGQDNDNRDSAAKVIATATARAALLGIEARPIGGGAWLLLAPTGACIGRVRGPGALAAAVAGFEAARRDMAALVASMARGGGR